MIETELNMKEQDLTSIEDEKYTENEQTQTKHGKMLFEIVRNFVDK